MKKLLKIITIVVSFSLFGFLCSAYTSYKDAKNNAISQANSQLYELRYLLDILDYLDSSSIDDSVLREKIEISLVSNLLILNMIRPKMSDLQGTPLSSLCRAISYSKKHIIGVNGLGKYKDKKLPQMVIGYLEIIEPELIQQLKSFKSISFDGCQELSN